MEDLYNSKLYRKDIDDTFLPAVQKIFNEYSKQATEVMIHGNRLLDKFYYMISRAFNPQEKLKRSTGNNRFCRLTIWTSGNLKHKVDGFTNNIHVDHDTFHKVFQEAANWLIERLEEEGLFHKSDIEYLKSLRETSEGKFQSPTVCGYDVLRKEDSKVDAHAEMNWEVFSYFALIGLGVCVKLDKCYHSFMAASVSHCTPLPISIVYDIVCTYTGGDVNIVGWGGGGNEERREFYLQHGGPYVARLTQRLFLAWLRTVPRNVQILARRQGLVP